MFTPSALAWAHRTDGARNVDITGTLIDFFPISVSGFALARDWAEISGGVRYGASKGGAVTAPLAASVTPHQNATYVTRVGVSRAF